VDDTPAPKFREPFARSLPIRDAEHAEAEAYIDELYRAAPVERARGLRVSYRGARAYERSLAPHRRRFLQMLRCPPPGAVRPRISLVERVGEARAYTVSRMWVEVAEGLHAYGLYLLPRAPPGHLPLVVALHGGGGCPEAICDLDTRENYRSFGPEMAERGWAVWAPSLLMTVGYGGDPPRERDRYFLDRRARLVGASIVGMEVHKIVGSLGALLRERGELDPSRVSMAGLSYGGYYTLLASAACPTVRAACCSGFFGSFTKRFGAAPPEDHGAEDRRFTGLLLDFDMAETAALVCPRALMAQNGSRDEVIPVDEARSESERARAYWRRLGIEERFVYAEHDGGHVFEMTSLTAFLERWG
jgi:dienelactone hydrolase